MNPYLLLVITAVSLGLGWGGYAVVRRFRAQAARLEAIGQKLDHQRELIRQLPFEAAFARAEQVIREHARIETWTKPIPPDVEARIAQLHPTVADFLRRYRHITFHDPDFGPEDGSVESEIGSEFLAEPLAVPPGFVPVGAEFEGDFVLAVNPGAPALYNIRNGMLKEEYPSIAHYIAISADPDDSSWVLELQRR